MLRLLYFPVHCKQVVYYSTSEPLLAETCTVLVSNGLLTTCSQDPTGNIVHLCNDKSDSVRGEGGTVVKAVESACPLLRVFVFVKSGGWKREVSDVLIPSLSGFLWLY